MILLALLLLLAAAAIVVFMLFGISDQPITMKMDGLGLALNTKPLTLFLLGVITAALVGLAWMLIRHGSRRKLNKRREIKRLRDSERNNTSAVGSYNTTGNVDVRGTSQDGMYADRDLRQ